MKNNFEIALKKVLVHEGGWSDHPRDPGGATNRGVIQRTYDAYRRNKGLPTRSVRFLETAELNEIYRRQYWDVVKGDLLPPGIDYVLFDGAVNSGPVQSGKWLQRALGSAYKGKVDGVIGQQTLDAIATFEDHDHLVARIIQQREKFLRALKTFDAFGKGWMRRITDVKAVGQAWAMGSVGPVVTYAPDGEQKAVVEDAAPPPAKAPADAVAGGGGTLVVIGQTIQQTIDQIAPSAAGSPVITKIVVGLTAVGAAVAVAGIAYRLWAARKAADRNDALNLGAAA